MNYSDESAAYEMGRVDGYGEAKQVSDTGILAIFFFLAMIALHAIDLAIAYSATVLAARWIAGQFHITDGVLEFTVIFILTVVFAFVMQGVRKILLLFKENNNKAWIILWLLLVGLACVLPAVFLYRWIAVSVSSIKAEAPVYFPLVNAAICTVASLYIFFRQGFTKDKTLWLSKK